MFDEKGDLRIREVTDAKGNVRKLERDLVFKNIGYVKSPKGFNIYNIPEEVYLE